MRIPGTLAFCTAVVMFAAAKQAPAEQHLRASVERAEGQWLVGTWIHQDSNGEVVRLVFAWDLRSHAIVDHVVAPGRESRGISVLDPLSGRVEHLGVDDRGGLATGTWSIDADKWVLRGEARLPGGSLVKVASVHAREGQDSMKLDVYRVGAQGEMEEPPVLTRRYERRE